MDGGLFLCCGQLVGRKGGPRHIHCSGSSSGYKVGGIFLELEYCPFSHCPKTFTDPQSNIYHQEEVHRSVKTWMCPICEISFVSEDVPPGMSYLFTRGQWVTPKISIKFMKMQNLLLFLHR